MTFDLSKLLVQIGVQLSLDSACSEYPQSKFDQFIHDHVLDFDINIIRKSDFVFESVSRGLHQD